MCFGERAKSPPELRPPILHKSRTTPKPTPPHSYTNSFWTLSLEISVIVLADYHWNIIQMQHMRGFKYTSTSKYSYLGLQYCENITQ